MNGLHRKAPQLSGLFSRLLRITDDTIIALVVVGLVPTGLAAAADYPDRPIRFIVPSAAGGSPDVGSRVLMAELSKQMGQNILVENQPTGNGTVGTAAVTRAAPDGYTMGQGNIMTLAITRSVMSKLPYDVDKDLQMVVQAYFTPNLLGISPSLPVKTVKDLVDLAKKNPGKMTYASAGNGSSMHLGGEMLKLMTGTKIVHVPYRAAQQAITEIIAGQVDFMMDNMASILPHVRTGRVRGIAVTSLTRSPAIPELPTMAETGVPGFEIVPWAGIIVPAGVPKPIIARINTELNKALTVPAVKEKLMGMGYELVGGTSERFTAHVGKENAKWADVVKRAGVTVD